MNVHISTIIIMKIDINNKERLHLLIYKILKNMCARQLLAWGYRRLLALGWASQPAEINFHCPRTSRKCMPNPKNQLL